VSSGYNRLTVIHFFPQIAELQIKKDHCCCRCNWHFVAAVAKLLQSENRRRHNLRENCSNCRKKKTVCRRRRRNKLMY
jgi:hypothetical protein